jgi:hypothetical protein
LFPLFAIGVNDTGGKFAAGVVDTGGNLPPASLIPAAICHREVFPSERQAMKKMERPRRMEMDECSE